MATPRYQIVVHVPFATVRDFQLTAQSLGFASRGAYLMFLHQAFKAAASLGREDRLVLRHVGDWGIHNFSRTPTVQELARRIVHLEEAGLRKVLESLKVLGLFAEVPYIGPEPYRLDVRISPTRRLEMTAAGRVAMQAVTMLESREPPRG